MLTMWDADGFGCGYNETHKEYPYLYFPILNISDAEKFGEVKSVSDLKESTAQLLRFGTCVKKCPGEDGPVDCLQPKYMIGNKNFRKKCIYTATYEMEKSGYK